LITTCNGRTGTLLNYVWLGLVAISVIVAAFTGHMESLTTAVFASAKTAVSIALDLIGIMALWLGVMKIAEKAGFIQLLARAVRPVTRFLFPDVPGDHPALGAMTLNISANWLGLGNAATPFGLKAMEDLQELNPVKDTASNAMIMLMALNTSSITLMPMTIIGVRTGLNSANPVAVIGPTIFSSVMASIVAVLAVKVFISAGSGSTLKSLGKALPVVLAIVAVLAGLFWAASRWLDPVAFKNGVMLVSTWLIPLLLLVIPVLAFVRKVRVFEEFVEGAKEGFQVALRIIPYLVGLLAAIGMFRASGAMNFLVTILSPLTNLIGMPAEVLPAALMRPLSANGTLGIITELMQTHGADSFIGMLSSTIYGCTETTFYVLAVYFGAVQIKKTRFAVPAGLLADAAGILAALFICRVLWG